LAVEGEQLIGYAHLRIGIDLAHEETAELMSIIVRPSHRRKGIGRRLVAAAETWAEQSGRARLLMRTEVIRTAAHAFFVALGYRETGTNVEFERDLGASRRAEAPTQPSP
jgi:GNAT superfamily N-acetyltransferase